MSMNKAQRAAETERLRTVATQHEQDAYTADMTGRVDEGTEHLAKADAARNRLSWLHQKG